MLLVGQLYNQRKKTKAEAGSKGGASKGQNDPCLESTAEVVATETGVSPATVKRAGKLAAKLRPFYAAQAKERQVRKSADSVPEKVPEQKKADARDEAGKAAGVNGRYASRLRPYYAAQAKERYDATVGRPRKDEDKSVEKVPPIKKDKARDEAGKAAGVNGRFSEQSKKNIVHSEEARVR